MLKIYLAARYSRRLELCGYRDQLTRHNIAVTSRWLNGNHQINDSGVPIGEHGEALIEGEGDDGSTSPAAAKMRQRFALEDCRDVRAADMLVAFTEPPRSEASRGGRHVELGIAIGRGKTLAVVGYRENIFCWLPTVQLYPDFATLLDHLIRKHHTP